MRLLILILSTKGCVLGECILNKYHQMVYTPQLFLQKVLNYLIHKVRNEPSHNLLILILSTKGCVLGVCILNKYHQTVYTPQLFLQKNQESILKGANAF